MNKPKAYLKSIENDIENELLNAITDCFNEFGGVKNIVKGYVFLKENAAAVNLDAIRTP
jgi:hypothetical protein